MFCRPPSTICLRRQHLVLFFCFQQRARARTRIPSHSRSPSRTRQWHLPALAYSSANARRAHPPSKPGDTVLRYLGSLLVSSPTLPWSVFLTSLCDESTFLTCKGSRGEQSSVRHRSDMDGRSAAGAQKLVRYPSIVKETQEFGIDKCYIYKQLEGQSMSRTPWAPPLRESSL